MNVGRFKYDSSLIHSRPISESKNQVGYLSHHPILEGKGIFGGEQRTIFVGSYLRYYDYRKKIATRMVFATLSRRQSRNLGQPPDNIHNWGAREFFEGITIFG